MSHLNLTMRGKLWYHNAITCTCCLQCHSEMTKPSLVQLTPTPKAEPIVASLPLAQTEICCGTVRYIKKASALASLCLLEDIFSPTGIIFEKWTKFVICFLQYNEKALSKALSEDCAIILKSFWCSGQWEIILHPILSNYEELQKSSD